MKEKPPDLQPDATPLEAAYARLREHLAAIEKARAEGADRLEAAAGVMAAIAVFLGHDPAVRRAKEDRVAYDLMAAIKDMAMGADSSWLRPAPRRTKAPRRTARQAVETVAALAMQELMDVGETELGAAALVARAIEAGKLDVAPRRGATLAESAQSGS